MCRERLPHGKILDNGVVGVGIVLERVLSLVEFDPGVFTYSRGMFFENEKIVLFGDEVVGIVISYDLPVFPFFNCRSIAHWTPPSYPSRSLDLVLRF